MSFLTTVRRRFARPALPHKMGKFSVPERTQFLFFLCVSLHVRLRMNATAAISGRGVAQNIVRGGLCLLSVENICERKTYHAQYANDFFVLFLYFAGEHVKSRVCKHRPRHRGTIGDRPDSSSGVADFGAPLFPLLLFALFETSQAKT